MKRLSVFFIFLFITFSLLAQEEKPHNPIFDSSTFPIQLNSPWITTHKTTSGVPILYRKTMGVFHLLVYVGRYNRPYQEIRPLEDTITKIGYEIMTIRSLMTVDPLTKNTGKPDSPDSNEKDLDEFLRYAMLRPGFRSKILMIHGSHIPLLLNLMENTGVAPAALIVLRPGEMKPEREELDRLSRFGPNFPVLFVNGSHWREIYYSKKMQDAIHSNALIRTKDAGLDTFSEPDQNADLTHLAQNDYFINFLLLQRYRYHWETAQTVFPEGCTNFYNRRRVKLDNHMASGSPDRDLCPLFIISLEGGLYRAEKTGDRVCEYRLADSRRRIRCRF